MTSEQSQNILINQQESQELKSGNIEREKDEAIGSYADLKVFLDEQSTQARELLTKKANILRKDLDVTYVYQALEEALDMVRESVDTAFRELSIASLRASCSELSDIVGFELEIDENGLDQFGLTSRTTVQDIQQGTGFQSYQGEKVRSGEKIAGTLEAAKKRNHMRKFDAPMADVNAVMEQMQPFGTVEYTSFSASGPVLIVLPEMHYDAGILRDSFELLLKIKENIALLATESTEGEITEDMIGDKGKSTKEEYVAKIANYEVGISTEAIEDVLGSDLRTLGVEDLRTLVHTGKEVQARLLKMMKDLDKQPELQKAFTEIEQKMIGGRKLSKADILSYQGEMANLMSKGFNQMAIYYRNQIWLNAIQRELLENQDKLSSKNNIVVLVCGGVHAEDISKQAQHYGFKGIVRFLPNSFNQPFDKRTIKTYMSKQMDMP